MSLTPPNLDDRTFDELVKEAVDRVNQTCPAWTDLSTGDPGRVLLELFAHLTETMVYRLNRLPEKAYYEFLNLMGVRLHPPTAARAMLEFSRKDAGKVKIDIPEGTRVTVARSERVGEAPVFITAHAVTLPAGNEPVRVAAYHCEWVAGELLGLGTGQAGLTVKLSRPPVIAPTVDPPDLVVGVEVGPDEPGEKTDDQGKSYRIWQEVPSFTGCRRHDCVYVADRYSGRIAFAPAARIAVDGKLVDKLDALAEIPPAGREIRAWYRRVEVPAGSVPPGELTVLRDPIHGLEVTNPDWAVGGWAAESLENALVRGPQEMLCQDRAVTARDFESLAKRASGKVARALAVAQADVWKHGQPGTVEVLLVPNVPPKEGVPQDNQVTFDAINKQREPGLLEDVQRYLDARRTLGVRCVAKWAHLKPVTVRAKLVVRRDASTVAVKRGVEKRLYNLINPLPTPDGRSGWSFGHPLYASSIYGRALDQPGVVGVDDVRLEVESAPNQNVKTLAADHFQPNTWYAGSGGMLFRSQDNGEGWELLRRFRKEIVQVRAHPWQKGLVAVVARDDEVCRVHVSEDCGESWKQSKKLLPGCRVYGLDWTVREKDPWLLLATDKGLYELALTSSSVPEKVVVDPENKELGFYAVAVVYDDVGSEQSVAVAAREDGGVYLTSKPGHFVHIGLYREDIRVLAVEQPPGGRAFLWAGRWAEGPDDKEDGCWCRELPVSQKPASTKTPDKEGHENWEPPGSLQGKSSWQGGSCRGLAFLNRKAYAATHHAGVLCLDVPAWRAEMSAAEEGKWQAPFVWPMWRKTAAGTPAPAIVRSLAASGETVLAGTDQGVLRSRDGGKTYQDASVQAFTDKVTLPATWLFCSGEHEITFTVMGEQDESTRD